jgi:NADPH:quinone reductase-like Zn-dependent oxidoreductase
MLFTCTLAVVLTSPEWFCRQQYVVMPEQDLVAVPDEMDDQTAAQFYVSSQKVVAMLNWMYIVLCARQQKTDGDVQRKAICGQYKTHVAVAAALVFC